MKPEISRQINNVGEISSAFRWAEPMIRRALHAGPVCMVLTRPRRSLEQNSRLWAMLDEISQQVNWHGYKLTAQEWKDVFTAALKQQKAVPGIDGGFVAVGTHTSTMTKKMFSDLIDLIQAFGAEHDVEFED